MNVIANSLSVLTREWKLILEILYFFFLGGGNAYLSLKLLFKDRCAISECLSLSLTVGLIPLFGGIGLVWLFNLCLHVQLSLITVLEIMFVIIGSFYIFRPLRNPRLMKSPAYIPVSLLLILGFSIFLRLSFISKLVVPPYFDSSTHYSIIQQLITDFETSAFPRYRALTGNYYHLGFHVLAAALTQALHVNAIDVMLILGQVILAIIPFPLYFLIRQITKSDVAGILAVLLGGWGWYMPAHAMNWGKYPALFSLLSFELVLCIALLMVRSPKQNRWILLGGLGASTLLSTFIHTRSFVLIVIAFVSILAAIGWARLPQTPRFVMLLFLLGGLFALLLVFQSKPDLSLALDPYRGKGIWMTLLVILALPFAMREFPRSTFAAIISMIFLTASLFISAAKLVPNYASQALLDRVYVQMVLFLPLALLSGMGYAGTIRALRKTSAFRGALEKVAQWAIPLFFFGAFFLNFSHYNFSPSSCCQLFGEDDQTALNWLDQNVPSNATIVVASSQEIFSESSSSLWYAGSDGGIWITPLIPRITLFFPYQTDFTSKDVHVKLCQRGVGYMYLGGTGQSFNPVQLSARPDWYERVFFLPKAQIYRIIGCTLPK